MTAQLCDFCGKSMTHYNHDGCTPEGEAAQETNPTPAVERAAEAAHSALYFFTEQVPYPQVQKAMQEALTAALTDPDDPDSLARTLFQIHLASDPNLIPGEESLELWPLMSEGSRVHWRAVADGLRMMLTGSRS